MLETAALLLKQAIDTPWILERLRQTVPTGIFNATTEQIGKSRQGLESNPKARVAALVQKLQAAKGSIDLSKIQAQLNMTPLQRSYWDDIQGKPVA